jgi:hypothetical protein
MNLMGDAELNRIALKGLKDYSSLNEIEKAQFMDLQKEFAADLRNLCKQAHDLRLRLETVRSSK